MNVLLKIVQGPNAGAEVVVAEGMTISLGKGDSCDILLADQSLADIACELEVSAERVRMLLPGGAEERLEPFHVKFLGETTAIVVGPEVGTWDELVWPTRGNVSADVAYGEDEAKAEEETVAHSESTITQKKRYRCCGCIVAFAILLPVFIVISVFLLWPIRSLIGRLLGPVSPYVRQIAYTVHDTGHAVTGFAWELTKGCISSEEDDKTHVPVDIRSVAAEYGLTCIDTNGTCVLAGNFGTRAQRLCATAAAYAAKPGVTLDLSDDESLRYAVSEVLELVSEGSLKVHSASNRVVELSGFSTGASNLRMVLEAIRTDVPSVRNVDCARVLLGEANGVTEISAVGNESKAKAEVKGVKTTRVRRDKRKSSAPKMPVVGVMTVPYPCIVLKDGSRVTEGAEFGGFIIDKISADAIRVKGPEGIFEWRP